MVCDHASQGIGCDGAGSPHDSSCGSGGCHGHCGCDRGDRAAGAQADQTDCFYYRDDQKCLRRGFYGAGAGEQHE